MTQTRTHVSPRWRKFLGAGRPRHPGLGGRATGRLGGSAIGCQLRCTAGAGLPGAGRPEPHARGRGRAGDPQSQGYGCGPGVGGDIEDPDERVGLYIAQALAEPRRRMWCRGSCWYRSCASTRTGGGARHTCWGSARSRGLVSVLARALTDDEILVASTAAGALAKMGHLRPSPR